MMATAITRAQLLRGDIRGERGAIRPPWALEEADFIACCDRCSQCISACPQGVLRAGRGGFPQVDFQHAECTFCRACTAQCRTGALHAGSGEAPWRMQAVIGKACLALLGVVCRACAEQCEQRAMVFRPISGHPARPSVDVSLCNGCGACVRPCPVSAITMHALSHPVEVIV